MHLSLTGAEYAYWTVTSDSSLVGTPYVAVVGSNTQPDASTVWTPAAWGSTEDISGSVHTRVVRLLIAGPSNGANAGSPLVVPAGEWTTWIRMDASPERIERAMGRLYIE